MAKERLDTENTENPGPRHGEPAGEPVPPRRKDTDLNEVSVSRRQAKRERLATQAENLPGVAQERAPWEESAQPEGHKEQGRKKGLLPELISGNILFNTEVRRAYPYMIFVAVLAFIYIANIFYTQRVYREYTSLTEQVKELRAKSMTITSEKMKATRQSSIMQELERREIPLKESLTPNKVIPRDDGAQETDDR